MWIDVVGCGWKLEDVGGYGWTWLDVGGCGWMWVGMVETEKQCVCFSVDVDRCWWM